MVEVHAIDCLELANGVDADWVDLSWGEHSHGATGRVRVVLYNRPGTLAEVAGIFAKNHANVMNLELTQHDDPFHTYEVDLEVQDLAHLTRIVSALRAQRCGWRRRRGSRAGFQLDLDASVALDLEPPSARWTGLLDRQEPALAALAREHRGRPAALAQRTR